MRPAPKLLFLLFLNATPGLAAAGAPEAATEALMQGIFRPISKLLPLAMEDATFRAPEHRAEVTSLLRDLRDHASTLEKHAAGKDRSFAFVAKSLETDALHVDRWYESGAYDEARFTLQAMVDNCMTCHASLPETRHVPRPETFFAAIQVDRLPPLESAHYFVISRRFDEALTTYEAYFLSPDVTPGSLLTLSSFVDYLKLCTNVKQDLERPRRLLDAVAQRPGLSQGNRAKLQRWSATLTQLKASGALEHATLSEARSVLAAGRELMEYPRDRDGLVHFAVASALLSRYVHGHPDQGADVAEAYYLLGVCEDLLGHSYWVSRSDFYLESAIRLAPGAAFAPKALERLEDSYTFGYTGSSGTHLPKELQAQLDELKRLITAAQGDKA